MDFPELCLMEYCDHSYVVDGFCDLCGLGMGPMLKYKSDDSDFIRYQRKNYNSAIEDLDCISEVLKDEVKNRLSKEKYPNREESRRLNIFCQIYVSGAELKELNPEETAGILQVKGKSLNKSLRIVSGTGKKNVKDHSGKIITLQIVSISPLDFVRELCALLDSEHNISYSEIKSGLETVIARHPSLLNDRPKYIAAGYIKYYCQNNDITVKDMSSIFGIDNPKINHYALRLKKLIVSS